MDIPPDAMYEQVLTELGVDLHRPGLLWAAAVGATHMLIRNTVWEDWHSQPWGLSDGEMMRVNSATVKFVHTRLSEKGTNWVGLSTDLTDERRRLPDGRTLVEYADRNRLRQLRKASRNQAENLAWIEQEHGPRRALLLTAGSTAIYGRGWHGMPDWPVIVEEFCAALGNPTHDLWRHGQWDVLSPRPEDIADVEDLRAQLLAGPDTMSAAAAAWCVNAGLAFVRLPGDLA